MNPNQTFRSVGALAGACAGLFFTYRVISDLRAAVDDGGVGIPGISHILLCWPVLLALVIPASLSRILFYAILALLDALTYACLFWIIASFVGLVMFRNSTKTEVQQ